jgi:hypothetical protein
MSTGTVDFRTKATSGEGGDFELPPSGTHPAILVALIDLGTHTSTFDPTKTRHKILLIWELTAESDSKGINFLVCQDYTWSLNSKAALREVVKGFRGKDLADGEEYDLAAMLGQPCMINLSEGVSGKGKTFIEVSSVSPPMRGLTVPPASYPPYGFVLSMINSTLDNLEIPEWVPKLYGRNVIDDIKASHEYGKLPSF